MTPPHQRVCLVLLVLGFVGACRSGLRFRELERRTSPDGQLDLVLSSPPAGATVSTPYEVFLVLKGAVPSVNDAVLRIDKAQQPKIAWLTPELAVITCEGARIWQFRNFATVRSSGDRFIKAAVKLECGQNGY